MRRLSVLDLVISISFVYFFLGREAQKVREWGVNSLKTSIFPLPTPLRGCRSILEIVFVGQCEAFVCLGFGQFYFICLIFSLAVKLKMSANGCINSLKTSIFPLPTPRRGCRSLLEIVFVGQCEAFVCLGFGHSILFVYFFPWPRSSKGPRMGRQFF